MQFRTCENSLISTRDDVHSHLRQRVLNAAAGSQDRCTLRARILPELLYRESYI